MILNHPVNYLIEATKINATYKSAIQLVKDLGNFARVGAVIMGLGLASMGFTSYMNSFKEIVSQDLSYEQHLKNQKAAKSNKGLSYNHPAHQNNAARASELEEKIQDQNSVNVIGFGVLTTLGLIGVYGAAGRAEVFLDSKRKKKLGDLALADRAGRISGGK